MRPFKITPEKHRELMEKFSAYLQNVSLTTDSFSFTERFADVKNKEKVFLSFTMKAYIKMRDLIDRYDSEIGWYGFVDKISDLEYQVTDICVYPQLVTGVTVKETNESWDDDMPIDQIKRRHFHGHSHVNMGVSPSATDQNHRANQVAMVNKDSFYIFMITNKKCEWSAAVFDLANNVVYNSDDVLMDVDLGDGEMLSDFITDARKMVKTSTPTALKTMMDARSAADPKEKPAAPSVSPWMPKGKTPAKTPTKPSKKTTRGSEQLSLIEKLSLVDYVPDLDDLEEMEEFAASQDDYFDDILGQVSDSPMVCNNAVLKMMR